MQPDEFRRLRKNLNLSQGRLAAELGLTLGWISKMELGQAPIERRTALALRYLAEHPAVLGESNG